MDGGGGAERVRVKPSVKGFSTVVRGRGAACTVRSMLKSGGVGPGGAGTGEVGTATAGLGDVTLMRLRKGELER